MTSPHQAFLEAPYDRQAKADEEYERVEESINNGTVDDLFGALTATDCDTLSRLITNAAERIIEADNTDGGF